MCAFKSPQYSQFSPRLREAEGGEGKRPEMRGWQERGTESGFTTLADAGGASAHHGVRGGLTAS